jgi:VWFA-related protein
MLLPPIFLFALVGAASAQNSQSDAKDLLARGAELTSSKPAEAVKLLQQALRLDPDLPGLHYQLGLAFHAIDDEADAAAEFREAVSRLPDSAEAHNYFGIALFLSGHPKAALEEFRAAVKLAPNDPNAHFNLGEAMARTGDSANAVEELRVASQFAPSDAGLSRLLKVVETAIAAPGPTIKVDVRQVLVPVVVTDAVGHHLTGLTQADFRVFEDGVEQKITAFSVEHSGVPETAVAAKTETSAPQNPPTPPQTRRTYLIVIDTLHTEFSNFVAVREALVKLFQQEHSADSQYVVAALGASAEMIVNVTPDPSAVIAALNAKRLQKVFLDGQLGGLGPEMARFRRNLNDTRNTCELGPTSMECEAKLRALALQAQEIADLDRTVTTAFLRQFRYLVAQLARAHDRRTIVLLSDGFQIQPGREVVTLFDAYFPALSHSLAPANVLRSLLMAGPMTDEFEPILKLAAASNIMIDTIDSRGVYGQQAFDASSPLVSVQVDSAVGSVEREAARDKGNTLREIADATGGAAFHDRNDLFSGLERAFADGRDYYTLAYIPDNPNFDGKFRAITVKVRDHKAVVNAKRGYWASPGAQ